VVSIDRPYFKGTVAWSFFMDLLYIEDKISRLKIFRLLFRIREIIRFKGFRKDSNVEL
jgi:hypothetical protein